MDPETSGGPVEELRREEAGLLACVHCGFCLNACPTYTRLGHEGDSPRGRLDLMRAVMEGRLEPDDEAFRTHIDRCLGCRACEPVCPSGVPYGFLLERARSAISASAGVDPSTRLLIAAYTGPFRSIVTLGSRALRDTGIARALARFAPRRLASMRFGLAMLASSAPSPRLLKRAGMPSAGAVQDRQVAQPGHGATGAASVGVRRPERFHTVPSGTGQVPDLEADIGPDAERAFAEPHALMGAFPGATAATPADATRVALKRLKVGMLTGCVQESLFARVNRATVRVLEANGCDVVAVPSQVCCGALDAHAGRLERARALARANIAAFERAGVDAVVVNAAGCGAMMKEYEDQLRHDAEWSERAEAFVGKVRDISEFLLERPLRRGGAVPLRVTYDAPCHLHHAQRIREAPLRLLDDIPGLERVPLKDADECCGGAGLYGVHHPELGGRILSDKVAAVKATGAEAVLTPNPGCMMQIGAGLLLEGVDAVVMHPIEVLDESYRRAGKEAAE
ncbi:MAG TPA: heterodisulfide reductase-related iron-sulfur binding cluster [Longimicrobiales bacterium]|nr:heterodisulfide reductase-related iron-sulfur binding cluster [Longimicrobiales bacterium]